jgi:hypothetical protein
LTVTIRRDAKPARVTLEPGGQALEAVHAYGQVRMTIPRVEIHSVIVVE